MKKALVGLAVLSLFIPSVLFAQTDTANFFSPVVQNIIGLLQDQIKLYQGQITDLQAQLAIANDKIARLQGTPTPVCPSVQTFGSVAPVAPAPIVNPNQARIDALNAQITTLDNQIADYSRKILDSNQKYNSQGGGVQAYPADQHNAEVREYNYQASLLGLQKDALERQLDLLR